ncbi:MAG TPA: carboxypeptidase-like regulatory domain-containing protein [Polyangia bacterium]|nr:carboxypeptidase-like regulatory domain-containing protein [Polyangia bacterium]
MTALALGCGPLIEQAPFPVRPDSIRPADLLGPYDGVVVDADSDRPVAGATVQASWAFETGIGFHAPAGAREVVVETGADGRYAIPRLDDLPQGASARVRRFTLVVYHRGHVAWRNDRVFPGRVRRRDVSQRGNRVRLDRWQPALRHVDHLVFLGGGTRMRLAAAWELQPAAMELEGERVSVGARGEGAAATPFTPLDITKLLSDDEIRGVTGYVGKFEDGKLTDLPTTEFYDSRHFKAVGKPESYDVGLRVWRLGPAAAEVQYGKLMSTLPGAKASDEIGDASFRAKSGEIGGLVFLVRERGVVVSMTCGNAQCTEPGQLAKIAKLVESRLNELPAETPRPPPPPAPSPDTGSVPDADNPALKPTPEPEVSP